MMDKAILDNGLVAVKAGDITVYDYDGETREYISALNEYLAVGADTSAYSCLSTPGIYKTDCIVCRSMSLNLWRCVPDYRGEIVYNTEMGESKQVTAPSDYSENTATAAPLTPYDKWGGEKWIASTRARHSTAVDAAEIQRQSSINVVMISTGLIQLGLQAGRKLVQVEATRPNAVLDYTDTVTVTNTNIVLDVVWPELPKT